MFIFSRPLSAPLAALTVSAMLVLLDALFAVGSP
jgi:hypothetical protein